MTKKRSDLLEELEKHAYDIASWRVDHIECLMENAPDDYPEFAAAAKALDAEKERMIQKLGGDYRELEPLTNAFLTYQSLLVFEVYVAQMVIRDEQDIRSLAVEIATLTRRQQRGKGLRFA